MIRIRVEQPEDVAEVRALNEMVFETPTEARIVDALQQNCPDVLSLVAEEDGCILGHILFSQVVIESEGQKTQGMGLAPMAVCPGRQGQGIGSQLVKSGIDILQERNCPFIIVLGHPQYYPRFGFELASEHGLFCQWDGVPDEAFMVMIMDPEVLDGVSGVARYRKEFDEAM